MSAGLEHSRMLSCNEICSGSGQEIPWLAKQEGRCVGYHAHLAVLVYVHKFNGTSKEKY
jgi:hypothetical protein